MPRPIIRVENVSLFIPGERTRTTILRDINLEIDHKEHIAITGANGSGKSTLLRLLNGNLWPASGKILWRDDSGFSSSPIIGKKISSLISPLAQERFQRFPPALSVKNYLFEDDNTSEYCESLCARLNIAKITDLQINELSQGQTRLVLLIKALTKKPALLLLDEVTDSLDQTRQVKLMDILEEASQNMAILFATHRESYLPNWVTRRLFIDKGKLVSARAPRPVIPRGENPVHPENGNGSRIFSLENVCVYIDRKMVLKNINWEMRSGEHWRILGENGSGKSTFLRLLAGDELVACGGKLNFISEGKTIQRLEEKRLKIKLISDLGQLNYDYPLCGLELVLSGIDNSVGIYRTFTNNEIAEAKKIISLVFPEFNSGEICRASIRRLSTGQLRRLYLARALIALPEILLLDEPFNGLDADSRELFAYILESLAKGGFPVCPGMIIVSHHNDDIPDFINREACMRDGEIAVK